MNKIGQAVIIVFLLAGTLIPTGSAVAGGEVHVYLHLTPGMRIDSYNWVCGRQPETCPAIDGFKAHLSSRTADPNGLVEEWLGYGNVIVFQSVVADYQQGLNKTFSYEPQAVVTVLKYPLDRGSATVNVWPEGKDASSYVAGPAVVLLQSDAKELFRRIAQRVAAGELETEDMWKAEVANMAAEIQPGW